jgi:hypothetical protein
MHVFLILMLFLNNLKFYQTNLIINLLTIIINYKDDNEGVFFFVIIRIIYQLLIEKYKKN